MHSDFVQYGVCIVVDLWLASNPLICMGWAIKEIKYDISHGSIRRVWLATFKADPFCKIYCNSTQGANLKNYSSHAIKTSEKNTFIYVTKIGISYPESIYQQALLFTFDQ